jgi:hypothetical protein
MIKHITSGAGTVVSGAGNVVRHPAVHAGLVTASVPAVGRLGFFDGEIKDLATGLGEPNLWLTLGVVALFGALGGVVAELLSLHGNIELPHRHQLDPKKLREHRRRSKLAHPEHEIDLGIVSRILLGSTAAIASLALYVPPNSMMLVAYALIAGSAATGVFRLVQGRMLGKTPSNARAQKLPAKPQLTVIGGAQSAAAQ